MINDENEKIKQTEKIMNFCRGKDIGILFDSNINDFIANSARGWITQIVELDVRFLLW